MKYDECFENEIYVTVKYLFSIKWDPFLKIYQFLVVIPVVLNNGFL